MALRAPAGFISASFDPLKNPNAPTIGTLTNAGATKLSVSFTAPSNVGGSAISGYSVAATRTSNGDVVNTTGSVSPIEITGLTTGAAYTARVFANNSYGPSAFSATSNSATPASIPAYVAYDGSTNGTTKLAYSPDLITWTNITLEDNNQYGGALGWTGDRFIFANSEAGSGRIRTWSSINGSTWTYLGQSSSVNGGLNYDLVMFGGALYGWDGYSRLLKMTDFTNPNSWVVVSTTGSSIFQSTGPLVVLGSYMWLSNGNSGRLQYTSDGTNWSQTASTGDSWYRMFKGTTHVFNTSNGGGATYRIPASNPTGGSNGAYFDGAPKVGAQLGSFVYLYSISSGGNAYKSNNNLATLTEISGINRTFSAFSDGVRIVQWGYYSEIGRSTNGESFTYATTSLAEVTWVSWNGATPS
jgi:hypothetical protein